MELTGGADCGATGGDEKSERVEEEVAGGGSVRLNDWLGSCARFVAALGRDAGEVDGGRTMDGERTWDRSVEGKRRKDQVEWALSVKRDREAMGVIEMMTARRTLKSALLDRWKGNAER
jgi:hypothetical protein